VFRTFALVLAFAAAAFGATVRLYLKDGTYQLTSEYQVQQDRVRYYSTERSEWEEIPLELVDLDRTKKEVADRQATVKEEAQAQAEEDAAETAELKEIERIPAAAGVYYIHGGQLDPLKLAESKVVSNKKRTVLKILSPVPLVPGKSAVELDRATAATRISESRPEFYLRLSTEESFGIIKLTPKKEVRVVENLEIAPVVKEVTEQRQDVDVFKKQEGDLLFKIWPEKDLAPGEYAVIQFTEGKVNPQVWDFTVVAAR
jgi:glycine/D-amino acid oxidase-like deaminating enzyme